tara:strand:- start:2264 stop:2821 length:558 start_codon:yes stop_codon:yes gene_type:complete
MKKLLLIALLIVGCGFSQNITTYISTGVYLNLGNKTKWGYDITGGIYNSSLGMHLKMTYGKRHFKNYNEYINYYALGGGFVIIGYEKGFAKLKRENTIPLDGKMSNFYIGGFNPLLLIPTVFLVGGTARIMEKIGIPTDILDNEYLPSTFYSKEKFIFSDSIIVKNNLWKTKMVIPFTSKCLLCN